MTANVNLNRHRLLLAAGSSAALAAAPAIVRAQASAHVVIVGGGVGGATAARYLRLFDPKVRVTLIEKNPVYLRPYGSSEVLNQHVHMQDLEVRYDALQSQYGVRSVFDAAVALDPVARTVRTAGGQTIGYDKLIVSPGISLRTTPCPGTARRWPRPSRRRRGFPARKPRCWRGSCRPCARAAPSSWSPRPTPTAARPVRTSAPL